MNRTATLGAAVIALASVSMPALGYVGPGAGLSLLSALWGLLLAVGIALGFVILWPIRRWRRRRQVAAEQQATAAAGQQQKTAAASQQQKTAAASQQRTTADQPDREVDPVRDRDDVQVRNGTNG